MQKESLVICIDDSHWKPHTFLKMSGIPEKGKVYEVREVFEPVPELDMVYGVALKEFTGQMGFFSGNNGNTYLLEYHFKMSRFIELMPPVSLALFEEEQTEPSRKLSESERKKVTFPRGNMTKIS